jgi:hypothetical protein
LRRSDLRKLSPEWNASAKKPSDLMRPVIASRTDSSSSTTEITPFLGESSLPVPVKD